MKFRTSEIGSIEGVPDYILNEFHTKNNPIALVIPVINEGSRIINQIKAIERLNPNVDVIIADGGSSDESKAFFFDGNHKLAALLIKRGPGRLSAQLRMAFHYCIEEGYEAVITLDGNNKDDVVGINSVIAALESGYDYVQGSRFKKGGVAENTPILRYLAIRLIHSPITSLAAGKWFTDTTNGFRGHRIQVLKSPEIDIFRDLFTGYELLAYLPIRISKCGYKVCEVPVARRYPKNESIPTKIHGLRSQAKILEILIKSATGKFNP